MSNEVESEFFARPVDRVAQDLIGRSLRVTNGNTNLYATILECEAYGDATDPASHAAFRPGGRASVMAGEPGTIYVYAAYGVYPCLNFVTGPVGSASAVLIRGIQLHGHCKPVFGPGRTSNALGVTLDDHGDAIPGDRFGLTAARCEFNVRTTPRVGVSRGVDILWRYVAETVNENRHL